jgi:ribonuclease G
VVLNVHPFIASYLTKGISSIRFRWYLKHKKWIPIIPRDAYNYLQYKFKIVRK